MCNQTPDQVATFSDSTLSPSRARTFVRQHACPAHAPTAMGALLLVTSELVTNSVFHGRPPITVHLACHTTEVQVTVRDVGPGLPGAPQTPEGLGLGLRIVAEVAREWGTTPLAVGTEVWCRVPTGVLPEVDARKPSAILHQDH